MERIGVPPGTELGGYRVLGPLGHGGSGTVYRAVDADGVVVALKVLHPHLGADPQARARLTREVAHLQRVRHPGVARVLDAEIDSTEAFIVTELVDGQDLTSRVLGSGPLDPTDLARLADDLHAALAAVHAADVRHRDLTPGNVVVAERGAVLIDFGIAQAVEEARVTSTGLVAGTPGYLAPELLTGSEPDERSDWWGWAAVLAFAATGRPPFGSRPVGTVLARVQAGQPDLAGLDPRIAAALSEALAVDPARRPAPLDVLARLRAAARTPMPPSASGHAGSGHAGTSDADAQPTAVVATDGSTRVLPVGGPGSGPPPPPAAPVWAATSGGSGAAGHGHAPDGLGERDRWSGDAEDVSSEGVGPQEWSADEVLPDEVLTAELPAPPHRRAGSVLALGLVLTAAGATWPGVALLGAVVLVVLVRSVGLDVTAVQTRRIRRGDGRGDVARAVVGWPWYLVRAALGALPAVLVAASALVVVGGLGWWLLDTGRFVVAAPAPGERAGELAGNAPWVVSALLALAVLVGLLVLWFGPMSRATRLGARWAMAGLAPGRVGAATLVLLALAGAGVLLTLLVLGQEVLWWPLPGPPDLR